MKPRVHFQQSHSRPVYYPPPVVPPPSLTCVFAIHGSDLTWGIRKFQMLPWGNVVLKSHNGAELFWGLESVFYNGTNVTDQVEDLVYPESGQQDMTEIHLRLMKPAVIVLYRFVRWESIEDFLLNENSTDSTWANTTFLQIKLVDIPFATLVFRQQQTLVFNCLHLSRFT